MIYDRNADPALMHWVITPTDDYRKGFSAHMALVPATMGLDEYLNLRDQDSYLPELVVHSVVQGKEHLVRKRAQSAPHTEERFLPVSWDNLHPVHAEQLRMFIALET